MRAWAVKLALHRFTLHQVDDIVQYNSPRFEHATRQESQDVLAHVEYSLMSHIKDDSLDQRPQRQTGTRREHDARNPGEAALTWAPMVATKAESNTYASLTYLTADFYLLQSCRTHDRRG